MTCISPFVWTLTYDLTFCSQCRSCEWKVFPITLTLFDRKAIKNRRYTSFIYHLPVVQWLIFHSCLRYRWLKRCISMFFFLIKFNFLTKFKTCFFWMKWIQWMNMIDMQSFTERVKVQSIYQLNTEYKKRNACRNSQNVWRNVNQIIFLAKKPDF